MSERLLTPSEALKPLPPTERLQAVRLLWEERGEPDAQAVLDEHPELLADKSFVLDLAYEECTQRYERGEPIDIEAYCARFPRYRSSMRRLLTALRLLEDNPEIVAGALPYHWPQPGETLGDLTVVRELGRGRFARAYLAREASTGGRLVVAKFTIDGPHEAQTLGRLNHPHIVPVLGASYDEATGLHLVRMPYLGQATLEDLIDRAHARPDQKPTRARLVLEVARTDEVQATPADPVLHSGTYEEGVVRLLGQLAEALTFLHEKGVCHRDLKPTNILLSPEGKPLLLDFNLSTDGSLPRARLGGTLPYMAPEQLQAMIAPAPQVPGPTADVFALGVIARELLTGRHPFGPVPAQAPIEMLTALLLERQEAGATPVRRHNSRIEPRLARLLDRCLCLDPNQRPTARQLAEAARRYLGPVSRGRRWLARRPLVALGTGLLVLALVGTAVALTPPQPTPQERAAELYAQGRQLLTTNDRPGAASAFQEANRLHPHGRALACQAYLEALGQRKEHDKAVELASQAIEHGYNKARVYNNRGYSFSCLHDSALGKRQPDDADRLFALANADFAEAIRGDPKLPAPYYNRALLALRRHVNSPVNTKWPLPDQAVQDIRKADELGPFTSRFGYDAACILASRQPPLLDEALTSLERAVKNGLNPEALRRETLFAPLHNLPRFRQLLQAQPGPALTGQLRLVDPAPED